ncbi:MAG: sugar ABC transporter permease, partial [Clostridiales bacterium]|nr:sugar ABC transporter permease [Clostridiales bacterium]
MLRRAVDGRRKASFWYRVRRNFRTELPLHLLVLPAVVGILIFHYVPIYGIQLAFKNFSYAKGIGGSPWVGMAHFQAFFQSFYFGRLIKNTVLLSLYSLIFSFPFPILFALLLNELRAPRLKKVYQTISYL